MSSKYHYDFDPEAENNTAATIYRLAAAGGARVLDLGSGPGIVAAALQQRAGKEVTCVDVDAEALAAASQAGVGRVVHADLDGDGWLAEVATARYDVVILADVLEHLYAPGRVLDRILQGALLADAGFLVVSIPNVAHEAVIASLLTGDFSYTDTGLLDATHIRFFTRDTFRALCERHGFTVARLERTTRTLEQTELAKLSPEVDASLRRSLAESNADHRTYQYVAQVVPLSEPGRVVELQERVEQLRQERFDAVEDMRRQMHVVEEELAQTRALHDQAEQALEQLRAEAAAADERARAADERAGALERQASRLAEQSATLERLAGEAQEATRSAARARAELDRLRRETTKLQRERDRVATKEREARRKLEQVYASETWRAGRALLWAPGRLKRGARRLRRAGEPVPGDAGATAPAAAAPQLRLTENAALREAYEAAVARRRFATGGRHVVMAVSTTDLSAGRGDLYTAVGLGRQLERLGDEVIYLPREDWYDLPEGTDVVVSMLAERTAMLEPAALPGQVVRLAWVRNVTDRWVSSPTLAFYHGVLCSSLATVRAVRRVYRGPVELLRVGVDAELFGADPAPARSDVVVSTVNSWGQVRQLHTSLVAIERDFPLALYGQQLGTPKALLPHVEGGVSFFTLPSVYGQAALVLDDQQEVNRTHGNVNARVFEALACGALPVTNSPLGLHEAGLDDLPVYGSPAELRRLVHHYLEQPREREALVGRLRSAVLERHTYRRRAEKFDSFVRGPLAQHPPPLADRTVIAFTPDYRVANPFQDMLYARGDAHAVVAVPATDPLQFLDSPALERSRLVFHLHWTAPILGPARNRKEADERRRAYVAGLDSLRARGVPIVWTVHNAMPHECSFPDVERRLRSEIAARADAIHVLCAETPELVAEHYELPPEKVRVIAHGGYVDVYPNVVDPGRARAELGLDPTETVLLALGGIRPYKGIDRLLDAFDEVAGDRRDLRLVVAGKPGRFAGFEALRQRCESDPRIVSRFEAVPDDDLQVYLNAADVVVLPHERVLNSGGLYLAWSFGRPVIAPRAGCLAGQVADGLGLLFDATAASLAGALGEVPALLGDEVRRACFERAQQYPFTAMSDDFMGLVDDLAGRSGQPLPTPPAQR